MRKHPDVIALMFLGFVFLAGFGMRAAAQKVETEQFRVRQLVTREARDGILTLKDALRECILQR